MSDEAQRKAILLVEDDEQSMTYVQVLLRKQYDVHLAQWASEAWDILQNTPIDLILMDISLPGTENGLELTQRIKATASLAAIPIIVLTAHAFPRDRVNSLAAGADAYISKPFDRHHLLETIGSLLPA